MLVISIVFSREVLKKITIEARAKIKKTNTAPGLETTAETAPEENRPMTPPLSGEIIDTKDKKANNNKNTTLELALAKGTLTLNKYSPVISKAMGKSGVMKPIKSNDFSLTIWVGVETPKKEITIIPASKMRESPTNE